MGPRWGTGKGAGAITRGLAKTESISGYDQKLTKTNSKTQASSSVCTFCGSVEAQVAQAGSPHLSLSLLQTSDLRVAEGTEFLRASFH